MLPTKIDSEIVLYQPDNSISIEALLENETIWLTLDNLSVLYERNKSTISRHIKNIFMEGELKPCSVVANFATTASDGKTYQVDYYNLDVIISVGYRVKSQKGVDFRKWANVIIKNHIIKANAINMRVERIEEEVFYLKQKTIELDSMVKTQITPHEGIFCDGQIFDAYTFVSDLVRKARKEIILIDNYVDDSVLKILDKREHSVLATLYTAHFSEKLKLDLEKHNSQYSPINIEVSGKFHDRFLILDDEVWHIGASLKDLGKRVFAFSKMELNKEGVLSLIV